MFRLIEKKKTDFFLILYNCLIYLEKKNKHQIREENQNSYSSQEPLIKGLKLFFRRTETNMIHTVVSAQSYRGDRRQPLDKKLWSFPAAARRRPKYGGEGLMGLEVNSG